jgi:hypothetical protein
MTLNPSFFTEEEKVYPYYDSLHPEMASKMMLDPYINRRMGFL